MISCNRNTSFSLLDVSGSEGQRKKKVSKCRDPRKCLCYSSLQKHSVYMFFEVDVEQRLSHVEQRTELVQFFRHARPVVCFISGDHDQ